MATVESLLKDKTEVTENEKALALQAFTAANARTNTARESALKAAQFVGECERELSDTLQRLVITHKTNRLVIDGEELLISARDGHFYLKRLHAPKANAIKV